MKKKNRILAGGVLAGTLLLISGQGVSAAWLIDRSGTLVQVESAVLGDSIDTTETETGEGSGAEARTGNEGGKTGEVRMKEADKKALEQDKERLQKVREEGKKKLETAAEARKKLLEKNDQKIKTTIENKENKLRVKQEVLREDDRKIKETATELSESEPVEIERTDGKRLQIRAVEGSDNLEIRGEKMRARSSFPIKIGENNELIHVNKDGTERVLTILPDAAKEAMEKNGFTSSSGEGELQETSEGKPVYRFEAQEERRILGLFRRKFSKSVEISAETGEVTNTATTETSPFARLLERLSR